MPRKYPCLSSAYYVYSDQPMWISSAEFPPDEELWRQVRLRVLREVRLRVVLKNLLLWISAAEFPDELNISRRAVRQAKILTVDFLHRISAR